MNKSLISEIKRVREVMSIIENNPSFDEKPLIIEEGGLKTFGRTLTMMKAGAKNLLPDIAAKYGDDAARAVKRIVDSNTADEQLSALNALKSVDDDLALEFRTMFLKNLGKNEKNALDDIIEMVDYNLDQIDLKDLDQTLDELIEGSFDDLPSGAKETLKDCIVDESPTIKNALDDASTGSRPRPGKPADRATSLKTFEEIFPSENLDELQRAINDYYKNTGTAPQWLKDTGWIGRGVYDGRSRVQRVLSSPDSFEKIVRDLRKMTPDDLEILMQKRLNDANESLELLAKDKSLLARLSRVKLPKGPSTLNETLKLYAWGTFIVSGGLAAVIAAISYYSSYGVNIFEKQNEKFKQNIDDGESRESGKLGSTLDEEKDSKTVLKAINQLLPDAMDSGALKSNYVIEYGTDRVVITNIETGEVEIFTITQMNNAL